ncbi:hypothetical protein ACHAXT_008152 [Thalassiosira profunda]
MRSTIQSGNGNGTSALPINGRLSGKPKKRRTIKLTCIGAILLGMYVVFIYIIFITFDGGHIANQDVTAAGPGRPSNPVVSHLRSNADQSAAASVATAAKKEPTVADFCGMCQYRGMGFNCNERVDWVVEQKGRSKEEAKKDNLKYCYDPNGCTQTNDEGFIVCDEVSDAPTIADFCGLCQYRDQGFNCNERVEWAIKQKGAMVDEAKKDNLKHCYDANGCNGKLNDEGFLECVTAEMSNKPSDYVVGTKHVEKAPALEALLSGSLLEKINADEIEPKSGGKIRNEDEEGLRDRRSWEDMVASVLGAAKYGDREYDTEDSSKPDTNPAPEGGRHPDMPVLTAYCEPVNQTSWETKPLPVRDGPSTKSSLFAISYPHVQSCSALPSQWPIDTPPVDLDSFLPWIHDVFPSSDGKNVVFIAQNRRRCYNGQRRLRSGETTPKGVFQHKNYIHIDYGKNYFMRPQAALFQHVPVKKIPAENADENAEPRYRLASHEDADEEGMDTRFICRFKSFDPDATPNVSIVGYTLSRHEVDYDYHTYRKGYKFSATEPGFDNHMIWQSQLLFKCPVPEAFRETVRTGDTVVNNYATLYVDLVPIRTPPRYTPPREFLQPKYEFDQSSLENLFIPDIEWGKEHVLPKIDESGRWENIPVCMPSLMAHGIVPKGADIKALTIPENESDKKYAAFTPDLPSKIHKVIACTWASTTFRTRSNRARVGDGKRRLQEWLEFNLLSGFDHIYVYDNSGAFTNEDSLADIVNLFPPDKVTRVDWPCKICSNRDGNEGERSSQYAAESSCRLRFGTHARWLGSFDTDEYLVPMGDFKSMGEVADELDDNGVKVAVFKSSPAKPRFELLESPKKTEEGNSFTPTVPEEETFLHTYNCNWEPFPRKEDLSHRRKQMYRADYVKLHYVHYSTITVVSQMTEKQTKASKESWLHRYVERHVHEFDESKEATMLHTKTKVSRNVQNWKNRCKTSSLSETTCHVGFPFPTEKARQLTADRTANVGIRIGEHGYGYNCFVNEKIEDYWWPKLVEAVKERKAIAARMAPQ